MPISVQMPGANAMQGIRSAAPKLARSSMSFRPYRSASSPQIGVNTAKLAMPKK